MKRIVSYSLWGKPDSLYAKGACRNVDLVHSLYPGWTPRFYCQQGFDESVKASLTKMGAEVISVPETAGVDPWFGLYWRFFPMFDDMHAERFIVRDTDSKISPREVDAVQDWIDSEMPFHIMRDNKAHNIPILGGMWGSRCGHVPNFRENLSRWMATVKGSKENPRGRLHGTDQDFLGQFVWPYVKKSHIAHGIMFEGNVHPFRITNGDGYKVGTIPGEWQ